MVGVRVMKEVGIICLGYTFVVTVSRYFINRIPIGPSLQDLDVTFWTFRFLSRITSLSVVYRYPSLDLLVYMFMISVDPSGRAGITPKNAGSIQDKYEAIAAHQEL
ncbi:hypothetical protein Tco_0894016 [Tanacetum coccineum]|uniref:Uncharacterized protein n=1 Tax=Tanacetum coccineum TaxID=301880 RepID=A0ABQ5CBX4_9ASTR